MLFRSETVIFRENGEVFYSTLDTDGLDPITEVLRREIPATLSSGVRRAFKNINGTLYSINGHTIPFCGQDYPAFYFSSNKVPFATSKYGVQYLNQNDVEHSFYNSFYNAAGGGHKAQILL